MKKKFIKILCMVLVIIMVLMLVGCNNLTEGEVYEKEFKAAESKPVSTTTMIWTGKIAVPITRTYMRHYPDRYIVRIRVYDYESHESKYGEYYVSKECYDSINIGDWFVYDEDAHLDSEPYIQENTK